MAELKAIVEYCNERTEVLGIKDFPGAANGLQFENNGVVTKIGAAVDGGRVPFEMAVERGIDFIIVHHGMFWFQAYPVTGRLYEKYKLLFDNNLSVYGCHLPLDAHGEIGNNAEIARELGLKMTGRFLEYEGTSIGIITEGMARGELASRLQGMFPKTYYGMEFGSEQPGRIAISSGSGASVVDEIIKLGVDTLITGELKQHHFNMAQEYGLNLYPCGHYATEVFGVKALAKEVSEKFGLEWEFLDTDCRL